MQILMPIDRSAFSAAAVDFVAARVARMQPPADVELVNVQHPVPPRAARALGREIVQAHHDAEAAAVLEPAARQLVAAGARERHLHRVGTVHHELASIVDQHAADLVVMASHGETGLTRLLMGSVASMVAVSCTKPLLILRGTGAKRESMRIALALDGSAYGLAAARFIVRHADFFGSPPEVQLVHVVPDLTRLLLPGWLHREVETGIDPGQARAMQDAAFRAVFDPVHEILRAGGLQAQEVRLVAGDAAEAIASHVDADPPDLLAMGSIGFGTHRFAGLGSVASRVASRTTTSLLLVRQP